MNLICKLLMIAVLVGFLPGAATAQQEIEVGTGLICDTKEQVEQFVKLSNEGLANEAAVSTVNEGTNACGVLAVAYVRVERVGEVRTKNGIADIVHIIVVAVNTGVAWVRGQPLAQYTLFLTKKEEASWAPSHSSGT